MEEAVGAYKNNVSYIDNRKYETVRMKNVFV